MTFEERFEKIEQKNEHLEKQNRNLKRWMAGIGALALAAIVAGTVGWVSAADGTFDIVYAKLIVLKDANGRNRMTLNGTDGSLSSLDENGKMRVRLDSTGTVYTFDANQKQRVTLHSDGRVFIRDSNGVTRVSLIASVNKITSFDASGIIKAVIPQ